MSQNYKFLLNPTNNQESSIDDVLNKVCTLHNLYVSDVLSNTILPNNPKILLDHYLELHKEYYDYDYSCLYDEIFKLYNNPIYRKIVKRVNSYTTHYFLYDDSIIPLKENTIYLPNVGYVTFLSDNKLPQEYKLEAIKVSKSYDEKYYVEITLSEIITDSINPSMYSSFIKEINVSFKPK